MPNLLDLVPKEDPHPIIEKKEPPKPPKPPKIKINKYASLDLMEIDIKERYLKQYVHKVKLTNGTFQYALQQYRNLTGVDFIELHLEECKLNSCKWKKNK